jgi:hypothetical protein
MTPFSQPLPQSPQAWTELGRALQDANRFEEAEAAYRRALAMAPGDAQALLWLSELIWMRTADVAAAGEPLEAAIARAPGALVLRVLKSKLLTAAGEAQAAYEAVAAAVGDQAVGHLAAAPLATRVDPARALWHAERAQALAPGHPSLPAVLCLCLFAAGQPERAGQVAAALRARDPDDQQAIAFEALAWRLTGDPRYDAAREHAAFVRTYDLAVPLPALAAMLKALNPLKTHPFGNSMRHGAKTQMSLLAVDDPAVRGMFEAFDAPIRSYLGELGRGGYEIAEAWSVRLGAGGYHVDHVHPDGWLSAAFYVEVPEAAGAGGRDGWLRLGQPGLALPETPPPEAFVQPLPGRLAVFPSCMWHGVEPFAGDGPRVSVGLDLIPA